MAETTKGIYYPNDYASVADIPKDLKEMAESIEKVIENEAYDDTQIQKDISQLKQKNTEQDTTIEELKAENIELKAENERLNNDINAISVTEQAEGENITLNDTADGARFKEFVPGGNSWQETRKGYNLIPFTYETKTVNGVTFTVNDDGTIKVDGTATANTYFDLGKPTLPAGDYILTGLPGTGSSTTFKITFKFEGTQQNLFGNDGKTFTINSEATAQENYLFIASGYTASNLVFKPMITKGATVKDYEQYGAMPSPEFKSDIRNCGDNVNLYDGNEVNSSVTYNSQLCTDRNSIWHTNVDVSKLKFPLTFSSDITVNNNNYTESNIRVSLRNANKEHIKLIFGNNGTASNKKSSLTILSNDITDEVKYVFLSVRIQDGGYTENTKIEQGTKATSYSTYGQGNANVKITNGLEDTDTNYQEQNFTFPLAEGQRLMLGDYLADDGIHHKRKQDTLNSDNCDMHTFDASTHKLSISKVSLKMENLVWKSHVSLCSHFTEVTDSRKFTEGTYMTGNNGNNVEFCLPDTVTSLTEAKEYMNNLNATFERNLAEEEIEAYTSEQQAVYNEIKKTAHSYGEQTHIFSTDETSLIFNVEARKDMNTLVTRIEKLESEV